jgi:hypothetical protein
MSNRLALTYNRYANLHNCENFDEDMLIRIEDLAAGLSETEALSFWGLKDEDLNNAERRYFKLAYQRGLAKAKQAATEKLFSAMSDRNGGALALRYLQLFGEKFPADDDGRLASGNGFSLKIVKE